MAISVGEGPTGRRHLADHLRELVFFAGTEWPRTSSRRGVPPWSPHLRRPATRAPRQLDHTETRWPPTSRACPPRRATRGSTRAWPWPPSSSVLAITAAGFDQHCPIWTGPRPRPRSGRALPGSTSRRRKCSRRSRSPWPSHTVRCRRGHAGRPLRPAPPLPARRPPPRTLTSVLQAARIRCAPPFAR